MSKATTATKTAEKMTRAKAERALSHGADPTLDVFTTHANKHVKAKAAKMTAKNAAAVATA